MFFLVDWFITIIYQPFFNLLVGIYLLLDSLTRGHADMGVAVILFTIAFRIIWIPISVASGRSIKEKLEIAQRVKAVELEHSYDPIQSKQAVKDVFRGNKRVVILSTFNIILQSIIALMLWRIFSRGLQGADFHLLYKFMPEITQPFNMLFWGKYDLAHPSLTLNIVQSLAIFVFEALSALFSIRISNREVIMTQLTLPIVSFLIFATLPAGKKLFIITTLCFSIVQMSVQQLIYWGKKAGVKIDQMAQKAAGIEVGQVETAQNPVSSQQPAAKSLG